MSNIRKFPSGEVGGSRAHSHSDDDGVRPLNRSAVRAGATYFLIGIRLTLFFVLYWLRMPITMVCSALSVLTFLAFLLSIGIFRDKPHIIFTLGAVSLVLFVVGWVYDAVLVALSPTEVVRTL